MLPLNKYVIFARIMPAVIASFPALSFAGALIVFNWLSVAQVITSSAILALLYLCGDIARSRGKRFETKLFDEMGGKPSVAFLRHRDGTFDDVTKARYRNFLAEQIGEHPPSKLEEEQAPTSTDNFYERCGTWLREHTRDQTLFRVLLEENINYGFRRNLYALKLIAIAANIVVIAACSLYFYYDYLGLGEKGSGTMKMIIGFAGLHSLFLLFYPSRQNVMDAARTYARQLIQSCESLMPPVAAPPKTATLPKKRKP